MTSTANVSVVIGSWGSYNECNERALGSDWINLCDYSDWDEIAEELKKQGFELDGIDEELFIQDIEGIDTSSKNWDYTNPEKFFNTLKESGIMDDAYKFQVFQAFLEVKGFSEWEELVENLGEDWDSDIWLYKDSDMYDIAYQFIQEQFSFKIPSWLENYIDYEAYGRDLSFDGYYEYSGGIIEIR